MLTSHSQIGQSVVVTTTMTTTFDASFLSSVPTGTPALPTGIYALPITVPSTQDTGCLQNTAQSAAWSCQIQPALPYQVDITFISGSQSATMDNEITLDYGNDSLVATPYGTRPPIVNSPVVMNLAIDSQSPERGPAWFFQAPYNKIVVIPEDALLPSSSDKRQFASNDGSTSSFMNRKGTAQVGQSPWICYWNGTVLETFIYLNQTSTYGAKATSGSSTITAAPSSTYSQSAQTSTAQSDYGDAEFLTPYPKVVKVQERRVKGFQTIPPYCK